MSFKESSDRFLDVFTSIRTPVDAFVYGPIVDYLRERQSLTEADALLQFIENGGELLMFDCRETESDELSKYFIYQNIPFVAMRTEDGRIGFFYRIYDRDAVDRIKRDFLRMKMHYCLSIDYKKQKKENIGRHLLAVSNLSKAEALILFRLCDETCSGDKISVSEMEDGTYTVVFSEETVEKGFLGKLIIRMYLEAKGLFADANCAIQLTAEKTDLIVAKDILAAVADYGTRKFIVGTGEHYIMLDAHGFVFGRAEHRDNKTVDLISEQEFSRYEPNYDRNLRKCLEEIPYATVLKMNDAIRQLSDPEGTALVHFRSRDQLIVQRMETELTDKLDEIVSEKIKDDEIMTVSGHYDEKLFLYLREAANLLDDARLNMTLIDEAMAASSNRQILPKEIEPVVPLGYSKDDVDSLMIIARRVGVSLEAYKEAISGFWHTEITYFKVYE